MNYLSLPLIISQLSAVDFALLAVVVVLLLFGRKLPDFIFRAGESFRTVRENVNRARGAQCRERRELTPAMRKRYVNNADR